MKSIISFITIALLSIQWVNANENKPANLQDIINKNAGNVIYLDFWASWCVPCRRSFPWMNQMQQKYGDKGFKVISINLDAEKSLAEKFLADNPATFSVIYDPKGQIATQMKLNGMPSSFMINAKGRVVSAHVGFTENKKSQYEQEIISLVQGD